MWSWLAPLLVAIVKALFGGKSTGDKAIETLLAEKQETIERVRKANEIRDRLVNDDAYAHVVREHFSRKDSD